MFSPVRNPDPRPAWNETRIEMARELAKRSLCVRDQIGALIVDKNNKIIGEGYNNPASFFEHHNKPCTTWCPRSAIIDWENNGHEDLPEIGRRYYNGFDPKNYDLCPALHAEANALMMSDRSLRLGGTIYVTSHPCMTCAKLISNSGLTGVYVGHDGTHEYRHDGAVYGYLMNLGIRVWEVLHEPRER